MQLNDIVQIIEFTDTDQFADAIDTFNAEGIVHSEQLPFLAVVYDEGMHILLEKLRVVGFKGDVQSVKTANGDYIIFDANRVAMTDAYAQFG